MHNIQVTETAYIIDGKPYDRITSILSGFSEQGFIDWLKRTGPAAIRKKSEHGMRVGNLTHKYIECLIREEEPPEITEDEAANCIYGWEEFMKDINPTINSTEQLLISDEYQIAGTRDLLINDTITLDIKTSNRIKSSYWLQVAVYHWMAGFTDGEIAILQLNKIDKSYQYFKRVYDKRYVDVFLSMLHVYRYFKNGLESI